MTNNDNLQNLKQQDIYSLVLFALYKFSNIKEYSTLSELAYILDKDSLLKLCEYFGGTTITIPTIDDIEILIYSLLIYQKVNIENTNFDTVIKDLELKSYKLKQIKDAYFNLSQLLKEYDFNAR